MEQIERISNELLDLKKIVENNSKHLEVLNNSIQLINNHFKVQNKLNTDIIEDIGSIKESYINNSNLLKLINQRLDINFKTIETIISTIETFKNK
jgi:hypothetical protein